MKERRDLIDGARPRWLLGLVAAAVILVAGGSAAVADGFLNSRGNTTFFTDTTRPLKDMPTLESLVPMPQNINPMNRKRVRGACDLQVVKGGAPVRRAKGTFNSRLIVLDHLTGTFEIFPLTSGRVKTDAEGGFSFDLEIATELFADGFRAGATSAWALTTVEFKKRKGSFASLDCDVAARR